MFNMLFKAFIICSILFASVRSEDISGSRCSVSATIAKRAQASWVDKDKTFNIYDITVSNTGSCSVDNVGLQFTLPADAVITDQWNLLADTRYYLLTNFGGSIQVGGIRNAAGVVISTPTSSAANAVVGINVYASACPSKCVASSDESSAAPSESSSASSESSSVSNSEDSSTENSCSVNAVVSKDTTVASWTDEQGRSVAVYRLTLTNTGSCAIKDYALSFSYAGSVVSMWNLESTRGGYLVKGFGESLAAGATYTGAGLVLAGAGDSVQADGYGLNCVAECSA